MSISFISNYLPTNLFSHHKVAEPSVPHGNQPFFLEQPEPGKPLYYIYIQENGQVYKFQLTREKGPVLDAHALLKEFTERNDNRGFFLGKSNIPHVLVGELKTVIDDIPKGLYRTNWFNPHSRYFEPDCKVDLILSPSQIKQLFLDGTEKSAGFLAWYHKEFISKNPGMQTALDEVLKKLQAEGRQDRIQNLFCQCSLSFLIPYLDLHDVQTSMALLKYAATFNKPEFVQAVIDVHPEINLIDYCGYALKSCAFEAAQCLFDHNQSNASSTATVSLFYMLFELCGLETVSEQKSEQLLSLLQSLVDRGVSFVECQQWSVEKLYFYKGKNAAIVNGIAEIFIARGDKITPRMASDMKFRIKQFKETKIICHLLKQKLTTPDEIELLTHVAQTRDEKALAGEALQANLYLEERLSLSNPVPISKIQEIRALKKEIKLLLGNAEREPLFGQYTRLKANFRRLTARHELLQELDLVRRDLKEFQKGTQPTNRLIRFYALFGDLPVSERRFTIIQTNRLAQLKAVGWKPYWQIMVDKALSAYKSYETDDFIKTHVITWLHGTKSSALPLLMSLKGLIPMGQLLQSAAPPCGACIGSENGINQDDLSGEMFNNSWDEDLQNAFYEAGTRFLINVMYASREDAPFDPVKSGACLKETHLDSVIQGTAGGDSPWSSLRIEVIRQRMIDENNPVLKSFIPILAQKRKIAKDAETKKNLDLLIQAVTMPISHHYTKEELEMIKNPYPIVFGSVSAQPASADNNKQFLFHGKAAFGADLQVAFTLPEKVEELERLLKPYAIRVYSFDTGYFLEMQQMAVGTRQKALDEQSRIRSALQNDLLPRYKLPYPKESAYIDENAHQLVRNIQEGYEEYLEQIEAGKISARKIHGPMHMARTAIWTQVLAEFIGWKGKRDLLGIAGGAHDIARQADGDDHWDPDSADFLQSYLIAQGFTSEEVAPFVHAIKEKDPKNKRFTTDIQRIIHTADALEIRRVLDSRAEFDRGQLCFDIPPDLLNEIQLFIEITDKSPYKLEMERNSTDIYGDLLNEIHKRENEMPLLNKYLAAMSRA